MGTRNSAESILHRGVHQVSMGRAEHLGHLLEMMISLISRGVASARKARKATP